MITKEKIESCAADHAGNCHPYFDTPGDIRFDDTHAYKFEKRGFIAGATWMQEQDQWIPVNERLPAAPFPAVLGTDGKNQFIVNYTTGKQIEVDIEDGDAEGFGCEEVNEQFFLKAGWYELVEQRGGYYDEMWIDRNVTHWQPMLSLPKATTT